ncbi:MAG: PorV/PorQ family protein [Chlorobiales bacterium]|nr:PorV/PorQ family protein [Chlorobiales bacterium]
MAQTRRIPSFLACLLVLCFPALASAQTVIGKYAGEFLALGVGGRPLGMGGAAVAITEDVTAGYWNPAGLAHIDYPQVALMHAETFGNVVSYDYAAFAFPFQEQKSLGISIIRLGISDIPDTRAAWDPDRQETLPNAEDLITYFDAADYALLLSYAAQTSYNFMYGVNAKFLHRKIGDIASAWGFGFDVGGAYRFTNGIMVGASIQDVTTSFISWDTGRNELISPTLKLGSGYQFEFLAGTITLAADTDVRFEGRRSASNLNIGGTSFDFHVGGEYSYKNMVAIRGGMDDIGRLTLGAGLRLSKLNIDYGFAAFNRNDQLGNSHRISLQIELYQDSFKRKPANESSKRKFTQEESGI